MNKSLAVLYCMLLFACQSAQKPDNCFDISVASPAFAGQIVKVLIDEAHHNMHTMHGTYKPFARLAQNDGLKVYEGNHSVVKGYLDSVNIYVVANCKGW